MIPGRWVPCSGKARFVYWVLVVATVPVLFQPRLCRAHSFDPALLDLRERGDGRFDLLWKAPKRGATTAEDRGPVPILPAHCTSTQAPGGRREIDPAMDPEPPVEELQFARVDCGTSGLAGHWIGVRGLGAGRIDVLVQIHWLGDKVFTAMLQPGEEQVLVPGTASGAPWTTVLPRYVRLGIEHIWAGLDHLFFVLGLLLLIDELPAMVRAVTAFSIAHTLTLALAALDLVRVPAPPVEAAIALSIVFVAAEAARPVQGGARIALAREHPWSVAFFFGLMHGLGFAGALAEVGLPNDQLPLALFSFNLGVELGQLVFLAVVFLPLRLLRRTPRWVQLVPTYTIGGMAVSWTMERIFTFWVD